ncbi:MAG TPA: SCP2 sterol-binding domain-containing protein [Longimicrobiaceae bacterium]|nr:SCP2 sterol-binding domain-containing protein [Longimicrobiaceae bacterium]
MPLEVFTEEWSRACCEELNRHDGYRQAAADWEGASVMVMTADPAQGVDQDRAVYLDAARGHCHGARLATPEDLEQAPYVFQADPATWKRLMAGEVEPVAAVMTGKLKLTRGSLMTLAKHAAAASAMVKAVALVPSTFPGAPS